MNSKYSIGTRHWTVLLISILAIPALASDVVTPIMALDLHAQPREPEMLSKCQLHFQYLRKGEEVQFKTSKGEACQKVADLYWEAVKAGTEACQQSFDPTQRAVMRESYANTIQTLELQCTYSEALAAIPCNDNSCKGAIQDVIKVFAYASTKEVEDSLNLYTGLYAKIQKTAAEAGCSQDFSDLKKGIVDLSSELSQVRIASTRYRARWLDPKSKAAGKDSDMPDAPLVQQKEIPDQYLGRRLAVGESAHVGAMNNTGISTGSSDGVDHSNPRSTALGAGIGDSQKVLQAPPAVEKIARVSIDGSVGPKLSSPADDLKAALDALNPLAGLTHLGAIEDGKKSCFLYQDPKSGTSMIGTFEIDPETKKLVAKGYPVSKEDADRVLKNPSDAQSVLRLAQAVALPDATRALGQAVLAEAGAKPVGPKSVAKNPARKDTHSAKSRSARSRASASALATDAPAGPQSVIGDDGNRYFSANVNGKDYVGVVEKSPSGALVTRSYEVPSKLAATMKNSPEMLIGTVHSLDKGANSGDSAYRRVPADSKESSALASALKLPDSAKMSGAQAALPPAQAMGAPEMPDSSSTQGIRNEVYTKPAKLNRIVPSETSNPASPKTSSRAPSRVSSAKSSEKSSDKPSKKSSNQSSKLSSTNSGANASEKYVFSSPISLQQTSYFLVQNPPFGQLIGKVVTGNDGEKHVEYFRVRYEAAQAKSLQEDASKLKSEFNKVRSEKSTEESPTRLDVDKGVSEAQMTEILLINRSR